MGSCLFEMSAGESLRLVAVDPDVAPPNNDRELDSGTYGDTWVCVHDLLGGERGATGPPLTDASYVDISSTDHTRSKLSGFVRVILKLGSK